MELAELLDVEVAEFVVPVSEPNGEMRQDLARIKQLLEELVARLD